MSILTETSSNLVTKQKDEKVMKIQGNHHTGRVTNTGPMKPLLGKTEKQMTKSTMNISEEVYCLLFLKRHFNCK